DDDNRLMSLEDWLEVAENTADPNLSPNAAELATIVFTSGTTGRPKGVMLSHNSIVMNAYTGLHSIAVFPQDRMLSFLPMSHMFERTVGYYLNVITGSSVAFSRSIPELLEDMAMVKPTIIITVPRIFERAYSAIKNQLDEGSPIKRWLFNKAVDLGWQRFEHQQGRGKWSAGQLVLPVLDRLVGSKVRQRFGGNLRFVVSGGAPLAGKISRVFVGLGIDILQGYGLTEASPILSVNTLSRNKPDSIGLPLYETRLRLADNGELQATGPGIMLGYWKNPEATSETMTEDGWLKTGDIATISDQGFISITGRIKEIIVMANGEKVPPSDMEAAICDDPIFEQAMIVGEGRGYLSALLVVNPEAWDHYCGSLGFQPADQVDFTKEPVNQWAIERVSKLIEDFPGYANIYQVTLSATPWTVEDGALTPTMKIKRPVLRERFADDIERMYEGH
ncbi:MAG: AMP-dependent synthetase/ligase, partial [bacterium]